MLSSIVRALAASGGTAEMIAAVVEAAEAERERSASERRLKERDKKRRQRLSPIVPGTEGDSEGHVETDGDAVPLEQKGPTPQKTQTLPKETPLRGSKKGTESEAWLRFKATYPKRLGSQPWEPARLKFEAVVKAGVGPDEIIDGAKRYAAEQASIGKVGTEFIMQAKAWLNQRCWQDYPAPDLSGDVAEMVRVNQLDQAWEWCAARYRQERGKSPPTDASGSWHFPKEWLAKPQVGDEWMETDLPAGMDRRKQHGEAA